MATQLCKKMSSYFCLAFSSTITMWYLWPLKQMKNSVATDQPWTPQLSASLPVGFIFLFTKLLVLCPFWRNLGSQGYWLLYRPLKTKSCEGKYISLLSIVKSDKKNADKSIWNCSTLKDMDTVTGHSSCLLHLSIKEFQLIWWLLWNLPEGSSIFHQQWRESKGHQRRSTTQFLPSASCEKMALTTET